MFPSEETLEISVAATAALLADSEISFRLIDCREEDEFHHCRIEGAELFPLSRFADQAHAQLLPTPENEEPLIIYCHHGMRSLNATHFLRQKGRRRVWSMSGGIDCWSGEIDPAVPRY